MALYKIDRSRNVGFVGKFKFNFQFVFGVFRLTRAFGRATGFARPNVGAAVEFNYGPDIFLGQIATAWNGGDIGKILGYPDPNDGTGMFGTPSYPTPGTARSSLLVRIKVGQISTTFDVPMEDIAFDPNGKLVGISAGSVEGYFYYGHPYNEFVDIQEFYPSENYFITSPVCPDNQNEYWRDKDLDKNSVRQWPKYTTLRWFETHDPNKKGQAGVYLKITTGKGNKIFSKNFITNPPVFSTDYTIRKTLNAWAGNISNSGYISVSSNIPFSDADNIQKAFTSKASCDPDNFDVLPNTNDIDENVKSRARIEVLTEAARQASFHSEIYDWKNNHTDELTAYVVGFGSKGEVETYSDTAGSVKYAKPAFTKVVTNTGVVSVKNQSFKFYDGDYFAKTYAMNGTLVDEFDSKSIYYDSRQKWLYGMLDGLLTKDIFDDLESPSKHFDFPDFWVRSAYGCRNLNGLAQVMTIDETDLPSGSYSIPIPLKGWKFNALSLYQQKEFLISGEGNIRDYTGTAQEPHPYGEQNLSGYRYLDIKIRSKNQNQTANFTIDEISKGPTTGSNGTNIDKKSWNIATSSDTFETIRIDLCNPDNKSEQVDNQDSPYPRLNLYTTSKPEKSSILGYIAKEFKPTDDFMITKDSKNSTSTTWINDEIKEQIKSAGILYLVDQNNQLVDYFEVNTSAFPSAGIGTNIIFGKPRVGNGKIKLAKFWNSDFVDTNPNYRKELFLYVPKNDITSGKTIYNLLNQDKDGNFPDEYEVYDFDPGYPDKSEILSKTTFDFIDGSGYLFINPIKSLEGNEILPYDAVEVEDTVNKIVKTYRIVSYNNEVSFTGKAYFIIEIPQDFNNNLKFLSGSNIRLTFFAGRTDDTFNSLIIKIQKIEKIGNEFKATLEYTKKDKNSEPDYDGIPLVDENNQKFYLSANAPVISVNPVRLVEYTFPADTLIYTKLLSPDSKENEVNAIDDYPQDENSNGPYYGVSRISRIELDNDQIELGEIKLVRENSLSNLIASGENNTFIEKTKFDVSSTSETNYYTRRFWQQNTDGKDEEEGDISWQNTITPNVNYWTLFPKTISDLCDDINKKDKFVNPRWLDPANNSVDIIRHPGWVAKKVNKSFATDPVTGNIIYGNKLDPDYLNSNTGYATWVYGNGLLALPSGSNTGSGTIYKKAIDINLNELTNILAQTIFHRINGDFPPGKPDLFGNTSLRNEDGTEQESTLHLRGGLIIRGPANGLILPPKQSTPEELRKATLYQKVTPNDEFRGSDETDIKGYYETASPFGKNKTDNYIHVEATENFATSGDVNSSNRNFSQAKRERASFKPGVEKKVAVTSVSVVETGFEHSLLFAYNVPSKTPFETVVISTDSFFDPFYEKNPVGFKVSSGTGQTIKGAYPFLLSSELKRNKLLIPHSFVLTEFDTANTYEKTSSYKSIIGANLNFRDKDTWYPVQGGNVDTKLDFNKYTTIFEKTKFNSFCLSDYSPQIYTVGYADPGALILQTTHLTMSNVNSPNTDKVLHIDGKVPTDVAQFRLFEPITTVGTASTAFASVCQIKSNELIVSYSLEEEPRKIFYRIISNNQVQAKNLLLDLDDLSGNVLNASYNVYGINSFYDKLSNIHKTTFMSNGNIYYHEFDINGSITGNTKTTLIHLIKGDPNDKLASALANKQLLHKYFDNTSGFASTIPTQRPGITACQKQSYASHTIIAYQTGKCKIEAVLFKPFKDTFVSSREFDIECPNETPGETTGGGTGGDTGGGTGGDTGGGTGGDTGGGTTGGGGGGNNNTSKPNAKFSADPTSGIKDLTVTFTNQSTSFNDLTALSKFKWDFYGDGSDLLETTTLDPFTYVYTRVGTFYPKLIAIDINNIESDVYNLVAITVNDIINQPPTADFTFEQNTFTSPFRVTFTDTSKDIDGTLSSWNWSFGDGNTSSLQNPINEYELQGTYNVKLIVTDNLGLSSEIIKSVTVAPLPNKPPIPDFTYAQRLNTYTVDFSNNSSDPENDALSYEWTMNEFDTNSKSILKDPTYNYQVSGTYNVTLKASDVTGNSASITKQIQVFDVNNFAPNIIDVTYSQTSYVPLTVKFSENSSDTDGYIEQWEWNFGDGSTSIITDPTLKNAIHVYSNPGRYIVTLTVTDNGLPVGINKKTASRSITVIVAPPPPNIPPVASFTVDKNYLPAIFTSTFTDQSTDSDGNIVSWLWELPNNQNIIFDSTNYSKTVSYTFTKSGTYTIKLTVTDNEGTSSTATQDIVVVNQNPSALLIASPNPILSKNTITLDASGSNDIDGNIVNYSWSFGDGVRKSFGTNIEKYVYNKPGSYVVSLTVTDNFGSQDTALLNVVVQNRNPVSIITYDLLTVKAPNSLSFSGTSSYDEDGIISNYNWSIVNKSTNVTYYTSVSSVISVPFTTEGIFTVTLTVTDNLGATNSTSVDVIVTPADNIPPIAILKVDKISGNINDTFNFNFSDSYDPDVNGSITRYIINFGDTNEEVYTYSPTFVAHKYLQPGTYIAKLSVIDNRLGISLETANSIKTITIKNEPPVSSFTLNPSSVYTFENISLTDFSTDAEDSLVKWTWNFGDGSQDLIITDPLLVNQTKQYSKGDRDYIVTLTVEDNLGLTNTSYKTVTVLNRKPIAIIKTDPIAVNNLVTVYAGTTVTFFSESYDIDGFITNYEWNIVGLTQTPFTTKDFSYIFFAKDTPYEVTLRVQDDQNLWSDTVSVFVWVQAPNTPPVVYLNANPPSNTASAPVTVFFDSNGTFDPDNPNELLTYFWDFGNGSYSSSPSSSTLYSKAGSYNVTLDVTDRRGLTTQRSIIYIVKEATTGGTTTDGTTTGNLTTGGTTTGGNTTGGSTGGNVNSTPTTPPTDTTTTTPPVVTTPPTTPPTDTTLVTPHINPPTIITGPPTSTTPPATTVTTPPTIDWFANPANQVPPSSGPIIDPNIQGTE